MLSSYRNSQPCPTLLAREERNPHMPVRPVIKSDAPVIAQLLTSINSPSMITDRSAGLYVPDGRDVQSDEKSCQDILQFNRPCLERQWYYYAKVPS